ncbi:MAG: cellulose biosynthesis cyclic di-GMP-binding regulatory protein BcsB [Hydrogenobacter sp.]
MIRTWLLILLFVSFAFSKERISVLTFEQMNLLSEDLVIKGVNPKYDFYIPTLPQLIEGQVHLRLSLPEYLRKDSSVMILVDDVPYVSYSLMSVPADVVIPVRRNKNRDFVKISIIGNLRISNNICEDAFSDRIYMVVRKDSYVSFYYQNYRNIREFLRDYDNTYCIGSHYLLPFIYQMCKQNPIPCKVKYTAGQNPSNCKLIRLSTDEKISLKPDGLYVPKETSLVFEKGIFYPLLFSRDQVIIGVDREARKQRNEFSLRELGIRTATVGGSGNIGYTIPLDLSRIGGMPDRLYLKLDIANSPPHQKDKMELRVYVNGFVLNVYKLEDGGRHSFNIEIPTDQLHYGMNYISINLVSFTSSDNCFCAITHSVLTVFDTSYLYWNSLEKEPKSISEFFNALSGYVALVVEDPAFHRVATKLITDLATYNKNIKVLDLNPKDLSMYDFLILFKKPQNTKGMPIDLSKGEFQIINPLTNKVLFASMPSESFGVLMLNSVDKRPALVFSYFLSPEGIENVLSYSYTDMLGLVGNVAVATETFLDSYQVGDKMRVRYPQEKDLRYYWNKYKLWILLLLAVPIALFLSYTYRKLTRRQIT